jgi:hypothetical protein
MRRFLCVGIVVLLSNAAIGAQPIPVQIVRNGDGWALQRAGETYVVRGGGGDGSMELLKKAGGNSIRTWGVEHLGETLDKAQALGLTVTAGIWLGHERHGFDYNNADQVGDQIKTVREVILKYKDHPALLIWGLGNEMEGYENGDNAAIWSAINNLASMAKRLDPNHPTMTVIAEVGGDRVKNIERLCPDIDIVGINAYGGAASVPKRYAEAGGMKPFLLTEYGPPGVWEAPKSSWDAPAELTSTAKAKIYGTITRDLFKSKSCLGGYAFTWGHKQEATATWFGLLLPDGSKLGGVDALTEAWTGKPPANRSPLVEPLKLNGPDQLDPGAMVSPSISANDPDGDELSVEWILQREVANRSTGGDAEEVPPSFPDAIIKSSTKSATIQLPRDGGGYRIYALVRDGHGGAATANLPILIKGPVPTPKSRKVSLPLVLDDESSGAKLPYQPSGYMGNVQALKLDPASAIAPHSGKACLRVDYKVGDGWGGVAWQSPASDWGDLPGGYDLTGAKTLSFWARGENGGEQVSFEFGILGKDKKFFDTGRGKLENATLTKEWTRYAISLDGMDLARIKTGFVFVVTAKGRPITFYLDDIRYE